MSELKIVNIQKYNKEIKKLYREAFPKNERIPISILQLLTRKNKAKFYAIYDGEEFIGLLYNVYYKDIVLILYLAIEMLCYSKNDGKVSKEEYESLAKYFLRNFLYKVYKKISK